MCVVYAYECRYVPLSTFSFSFSSGNTLIIPFDKLFQLKCCNEFFLSSIFSSFSCFFGFGTSKQNKKFTLTVVVVSYLNDLVCPFSKNTFRTFAICGTCKSPNENADGCK